MLAAGTSQISPTTKSMALSVSMQEGYSASLIHLRLVFITVAMKVAPDISSCPGSPRRSVPYTKRYTRSLTFGRPESLRDVLPTHISRHLCFERTDGLRTAQLHDGGVLQRLRQHASQVRDCKLGVLGGVEHRVRELVDRTRAHGVNTRGSKIAGSHFLRRTCPTGHAGRSENLVQSVIVVLEDVHNQERLVDNLSGEDTAGEVVAVVVDFLALRVGNLR